MTPIPSRVELAQRIRDAWPAHAAALNGAAVLPVRSGSALAALIALAVDMVLDAVEGVTVEDTKHPFPGNVLQHVAGMGQNSDDPSSADKEVRTDTDNLDAAVTVTSRMRVPSGWPGAALHRPVLDIDMPVRVFPSSTPGHHHLYIDAPMTWDRYLVLLDALVAADIVQPGYVGAARAQHATCVRVPWLRKGDPEPALPAFGTAGSAAHVDRGQV